MNLHFDNYIAFSYPEEFFLEPYAPAHQYCLFHGHMSIFISLIHDDFDWRFRWQDAGRIVDMPDRQIVKDGIGIPGGKMSVEDFNRHGFQGRVKRTLFYDVDKKFSDKFVLAVLSKGSNRLEVRAQDRTDFPEEVLDHILGSLAFPGEEAYERAREQYGKQETKPPPNTVELRHFPGLGGSERRRPDRFRVVYEGKGMTAAQSEALHDLLKNEEAIFERTKRVIFRYYSETIYPLLESALGVAWEGEEGAEELLPTVREVRDVIPLVQLGSILVHEAREDGSVPVGLRFDCDWDPEHGLGVRVVGRKVEAVGSDYVALCPDLQEWPNLSTED